MAEAIMLREHGGPERLRAERLDLPPPGPGELRIRQTAIGVNFHDVYVRTGLYKTLPLPGIPGIEAVGVVEDTGPEVTGFAVGDRVGYVTGSYGAYASERNLPAEIALKLPDALSDRLAATVLLKALTVEMLVRRVHRVEAGQTVLVHAAAGGVGRLLAQWAAGLGAVVIGTAGTPEKLRIAKEAGCAHVIAYRETDFAAEVLRLTGGRGVDVAYDSVGRDTFDGSMKVLAPLGRLVNFGQSSGPIPPFEISRLAAGSWSVVRPIIFHYLADAARRRDMAKNVFSAFAEGLLTAEAGTAYPLADAGQAHAALEARSDRAPFILVPGEI